MPVLKFKSFEDLDRLEKEGKGITWHFTRDEIYLKKALRFHIKVPSPHGVYKFKTFEEAEKWEMEQWVKSGTFRRTR